MDFAQTLSELQAAEDAKRKRDPLDDGDGSDGSDDDESNMSESGGKNLSKADKRAHHNALERKRRDHIKDSFSVLRDAIPSLNGEKPAQASRAQILNKATDYIQLMRKKNMSHQAEMEELKKQNAMLMNQASGLGASSSLF